MMGNYFSAAYFSVLLTFISLPISTALFPTFSKINAEREPGLAKMVFASSVKIHIYPSCTCNNGFDFSLYTPNRHTFS